MNTPKTAPKVRLSAREIDTIEKAAKRIFGPNICISIFGSRAQENAKGGDIDILIETDEQVPNRVALTCRLTTELQMQLGDQKIDIILIDPDTSIEPIHEIARQTGVKI